MVPSGRPAVATIKKARSSVLITSSMTHSLLALLVSTRTLTSNSPGMLTRLGSVAGKLARMFHGETRKAISM